MRKGRGYSGANQLSLRKGNRSVIIRAVWTLRRISRIELAVKTGLHPATITHIVDELVAEGLLKESGSAEVTIGRPALQLEMNPEAAYIVGVNVNRDSISAGLVDLNGNIIQDAFFGGLQIRSDNQYIKSRLLRAIEIILEDASLAGRRVIGIGVGAPEREYLTPPHRRFNPVPVPGEADHEQEQPLSEFIEARFKLPVVVDHNANTLSLDLQYFGNVDDAINNFVLLRCGFGIGGSLVLNHEIHYASHGGSSELGHLTVDTAGPRCRCGNIGCLELYCSVPAILERLAPELNIPATALTVEQVAAAYGEGHKGVAAALSELSKYFATAIVTITNTVAPDAVFIGGPLGPLSPIFADLVQPQVKGQVYPTLAGNIQVAGIVQPGGPVRGAAMLIIRNVLKTGTLSFTAASEKEASIAG